MPDETKLEAAAPIAGPIPDSVRMRETTVDQEASASDQTFTATSRRLRMTDDERADLSQLMTSVLDAIKSERDASEMDANWDLWEDLYFGVLPDRPAGQSNAHVPLAQEVVDTGLAAIEEVLFGSQPYLQVSPREAMDVDQAKRKEQFLDYALTVEMQAKDRLKPSLWEAVALGTGVTYLPWLREIDRLRDEETYDGTSLDDLQRFSDRFPH